MKHSKSSLEAKIDGLGSGFNRDGNLNRYLFRWKFANNNHANPKRTAGWGAERYGRVWVYLSHVQTRLCVMWLKDTSTTSTIPTVWATVSNNDITEMTSPPVGFLCTALVYANYCCATRGTIMTRCWVSELTFIIVQHHTLRHTKRVSRFKE